MWLQARAFGNHLTRAFGHPSELDGALCQRIGELLDMVCDRVEQLMQRDEGGPWSCLSTGGKAFSVT
jgi:hypothetical protein